ncbi:LexA family transcriptional regulator [Liquorilactobacillus hordei]|uniref:LexA family transcriptional regulator n=1 Tax=Liquorilactobacillus hordei TaxID=468911 RepID=UPI0039E7B53F
MKKGSDILNREEFLRSLMISKYGSIKEFSRIVEIKYTTIMTMLKNGIGNAGVDNVLAICEKLDISPEILKEDLNISELERKIIDNVLNLSDFNKKRTERFTVDLLNEQNSKTILSGRSTAAGAPIDGDYEDAQQEIIVRNEVPRGADEVVTIAGDSMEPLLKQGSQAFVHYQPTPDTDGQIVIVSIKGDGVTCKRIYREDGKIRLKSINEKYEDMVFPAEDIRIIGKIIIDQKK